MHNNTERLDLWLSVSHFHSSVNDKLEQALLGQYDISLKEFYVLKFISSSPCKELRLQQLQEKVGLSQSATSRLVDRMEAPSVGALERHTCTLDRRGIYTRITALGEQKYLQALATVNQVLNDELQRHGILTELDHFVRQLLK
ncbi:MarR family transcriptional regulator [Paenibacillus sp. 1011MAR3C5]|uniref:MarR family winged helix-turn-helix transcriptional regulator n=1 Tax=Paenibacillus sp. 1011MAR3C5 TaxID=1675787 RepID=UPI000E6BE902|nr:MarR family transcriptional regulator [Paenibacillus sp. 1011MAR3C5]RJE90428.1 MarR family transcriptional regulator [Paenibacillus sp. 1011MAR3C5]